MPKIKTAKTLPFFKQRDLGDLEYGMTLAAPSRVIEVKVSRNISLSNKAYDELASDLTIIRPYLKYPGVESKWFRITSEGRKTLLINPAGHEYPRFTGFEIKGK